MPNYKIENKLWKNGLEYVAGLDEAGRGSWAGPVVAAAVVLPGRLRLKGLRDSKLMTPRKREELFRLIKMKALGIGVGVVSHKEIDKQGIIPATRKAFLLAIEQLPFKPHYLLVDGVKIFEYNKPLEFFIKGDNRIMSIAAASVVAKVTRDYILVDYHKKYPEYGFHLHKGYGTKRHREALEKYGVCEVHRMSYKPVFENF